MVDYESFYNKDGEDKLSKLYWRHYNENGERQAFENQYSFLGHSKTVSYI